MSGSSIFRPRLCRSGIIPGGTIAYLLRSVVHRYNRHQGVPSVINTSWGRALPNILKLSLDWSYLDWFGIGSGRLPQINLIALTLCYWMKDILSSNGQRKFNAEPSIILFLSIILKINLSSVVLILYVKLFEIQLFPILHNVDVWNIGLLSHTSFSKGWAVRKLSKWLIFHLVVEIWDIWKE